MKFSFLIQASMILLASCIGTDFLDDPIVEPTLEIVSGPGSVTVDRTIQLGASYTNEYGVLEDVSLDWFSENPSVASVNASGVVTGVSRGQTDIFATYDDVVSGGHTLVVVRDLTDVASVLITGSSKSMMIGETLQLAAEARNAEDDILMVSDLVWESSATGVATVNEVGLVTAVANGMTSISVSVGEVVSEDYQIAVGINQRTGSFVGFGSYDSSGDGRLFVNEDEDLILELAENFATEFAVGTVVFLFNGDPTNGNAVKNNGLRVSDITENGFHSYNISDLDETIGIGTYEYIVVLCFPFAITFGYAQLN